MKVRIENQGDTDVRVVTDHDTINDTVLEVGATDVFESNDEGIIELRDVGDEDEQREAEEREQA